MPPPKAAGRDPRLGKVSSRILNDIINEYDSGQKERLFRRIRRLQARAYKMAMDEGGCETYGPDGPMPPPPCAIAAQVANQIAMSEEVISRIRERDSKTEAHVTALFNALYPVDKSTDETPKFVIELSIPERPKPEPNE